MKKQKLTYLDMQTEEASLDSGRYALSTSSTPAQSEARLFANFKAIALSLGLDVGVLPSSPAHFGLGTDRPGN